MRRVFLRASRGPRGFTLVEIMVAMVVLSMLAAGLFSVMVSARHFIARSKRRLIATELARGEMERLRDYIDGLTWNNGSGVDPLAPNAGWTGWSSLATRGGVTYQYRYRATDDSNFSRRAVHLQVRWDETTI
jgi:prepilin-type N-terminal cleavage/methylation domain-containing protein